MMNQTNRQAEGVSYDRQAGDGRNVRRMGFWAAILTALAAAAALGIAMTTAPARSGPFCMVDPCVVYPYTEAAAFVPNDYMWMYPAFLMGPLFLMLITSIHHYVPLERRVFSQVALCLAVISATALSANYFIQVTVVQPSLLLGELEGLTLFSQYNPHGIFIALEDLGYLMMGAAFLFTAAALGGDGKLERVIHWLLLVSGVLAVGSLIVLGLIYGSQLEYLYEVTSLLIDWITLIVSGVLLGLYFSRPRF